MKSLKLYMQLQEFIKETLKQIIDGVVEAQTYAEEKNAKIVPKGLVNVASGSYLDKYHQISAQVVDFDVAVSTIEKNEVSAKAGIFVTVFNAGIKGNEGLENSTISRIKFTLPILLPQQE